MLFSGGGMRQVTRGAVVLRGDPWNQVVLVWFVFLGVAVNVSLSKRVHAAAALGVERT